jgi:hypothetical protein
MRRAYINIQVLREYFMTEEPKWTIRTDDDHVTVRKLFTKNGERVAIEHGNEATHLDPLALQSVSWQQIEDIQKLVGYNDPNGSKSQTTDDIEPESDSFRLANEFAIVDLQKVSSGANELVKIHSPRFNDTIYLGVAELVGLLKQEPETFYQFLEHPFGPPRADRVHD